MRSEWETSTLGEVAELTIGRTPPRKEQRYWTTALDRPFCSIADMRGNEIDPTREGVTEVAEEEGLAKRVPKGALLMSFKLTIGRVGFAARDLFPNEAIVWVRPREEVGLDSRFLAAYLAGFDYSGLGGRAVKGQTLNLKTLKALPVVLPPLGDQRKVADLLGAAQSAEQAAAATRESVEGLTRTLVRTLLARCEGTLRPLSEVVKIVGGGAFPRARQGAASGDVPFLKVSDMNSPGNERVITSSANWVTEAELAELKVKSHPAGTIIFPKVGAALKTEKRRILGIPAAFDNNVMGLVASDKVLPEYLLLCVEQIRLSDRAQEGAVPSVNKAIVEAIQIPVPDVDQQQAIVAQAASANKVLASALSEEQRLGQLRRSLASTLLSGEHQLPESYDRFLEGREDDDLPPAAVEEAVAS